MEPNTTLALPHTGGIRKFPMRSHGLRYRAVAAGDVDFIVAHVTDASRHAVFPFTGPGRIEIVLPDALSCSAFALTAVASDDEPVAIIGLVRLPGENRAGSPWMMSTGRARAFRRALLADAKQILSEMRTICPYLINFANSGNVCDLEWLRRLGFALYHPEPFGALHYRFDMHDSTRLYTAKLYNYKH